MCERRTAVPARECLLPGVRSHVGGQGLPVCERGAADFTRKRSFACVVPHVVDEVLTANKCGATGLAHKPVVHHVVFLSCHLARSHKRWCRAPCGVGCDIGVPNNLGRNNWSAVQRRRGKKERMVKRVRGRGRDDRGRSVHGPLWRPMGPSFHRRLCPQSVRHTELCRPSERGGWKGPPIAAVTAGRSRVVTAVLLVSPRAVRWCRDDVRMTPGASTHHWPRHCPR